MDVTLAKCDAEDPHGEHESVVRALLISEVQQFVKVRISIMGEKKIFKRLHLFVENKVVNFKVVNTNRKRKLKIL